MLEVLPFQAIYNTPLLLIAKKGTTLAECTRLVLVQMLWLAALLFLSRLFYRKASKVLTVNGG